MNFVILHGTGDTSEGHWFPWLKRELGSRGHQVWAPNLPDADMPNIAVYNKFLLESGYDFSDSIIIGHSSGAVAINGLLQSLPDNSVIAAAILVGAFKGDLDWESLKGMNVDFDYSRIKKHAREFIVIHSDNDPYCPLDGAKEVAEQLDAEFVVLPGAGHFNIGFDPRFNEFPELINILEKRSLV